MAYSGSVNILLNLQVPDCNPDDVITIEFYNTEKPINFTSSFSVGNLTIDVLPTLNGAFPFATSSAVYGNFISGTFDPNVIIFNKSISYFHGSSYQQVPNFESGSGNNITIITSSLYNRYGEINYAFDPKPADKIIMKSVSGVTQVLTVSQVEDLETYSDGKLRLITTEELNKVFLDSPQTIDTFLLVKKVKDEQNIILQYKKPDGQTSYGFVIPENINPVLLDNIASIQSSVQQQLLSNQQNSQ